jgi:hypothetical protein
MSDIQANFTAQTSQATASIDQVGAAFDRMTAKVKKANKEAKDLQAQVSKGFKQSAEGISKAGGPLGSIGGRVLGGIGMGGGLGIASAGLAVITTSLSALTAASDRAVKTVTDTAAAIDKLQAAADKGQKGVEAQASAGAAQAPTIRKLFSMGGKGALNKLGDLEQEGISTDSAAAGLQSLMSRFPGRDLGSGAAGNAIAQAGNLAKLGMDFKDAIDALIQQGGLGDPESARRSAALVYRNQSGQRGDPAELFRNALSRVGDSQYLTDEEEARRIAGKLPGSQRARSGELPGMAREELAKAVEPVSAALLEANNIAQKIQDLLQQQADAEFGLVRWLKTAGRAYGLSQGSAQQLANDNANANAAALSRPDR